MVYVDLLVIEDLIMNYIVLTSVSLLLNRISRFKKIFLSSVLGTIPLLFLFININKIYLLIITFIFSIIMSIISFKYRDIIYTIKNVIYMYFISIFLAGSLYLINTNILPTINNIIFNFLILLFLSPIITYIFIIDIPLFRGVVVKVLHKGSGHTFAAFPQTRRQDDTRAHQNQGKVCYQRLQLGHNI